MRKQWIEEMQGRLEESKFAMESIFAKITKCLEAGEKRTNFV